MADFVYTARSANGSVQKGTISSPTRQAAVDTLKQKGLHPLLIKPVKKASLSMDIKIPGTTSVKSKDIVIFTRQLSTMVSAGVPLNRSLATLQEQATNKYFKTVIGQIAKDVEAGTSIGDALGKHPDVFSDVYVSMVRAGEAGGILDDILKRLALQVEQDNRIKGKVRSAMAYPVALMVITVGAFFGLMVFIVPKIGGIVKDLGGPDAKLPALTQAMLSISDFMREYALYIIIISVIVGFVLRRYIRTPSGKYKFHGLLLRAPVLGMVITKVAIARFSRTFSSLMSAGVSVLDALEVTAQAIGNKVIEKELLDAANEVKAGKQLSEPISKSPHFPTIVSQMLAVGEETGQIDMILVKVADFYEEEVSNTVDGLSSILEPVMIVVLGGMVGLVAASVMGPIASLGNTVTDNN